MTDHEALMRRAMHMADHARLHARPNPWVGAVLVCGDGRVFEGFTQPPGGAHAEADRAEGAVLLQGVDDVGSHQRVIGGLHAVVEGGVIHLDGDGVADLGVADGDRVDLGGGAVG